jgi:hypothetical protein
MKIDYNYLKILKQIRILYRGIILLWFILVIFIWYKAKNSIVDKINQTPFMKGIKNVSKGFSEIIPNISSAIKNKIKNSG